MSIEATLSNIAESLATIAKEGIRFVAEAAATPETPDKPETPETPAKGSKGRKGKKAAAAPPAPAASEPAASEPATGDDDEPEVTADHVRESLREFMKGNNPEAAKAILEKHGASSVTALKPENYAAVIAEFTGAPVDPSDLA